MSSYTKTILFAAAFASALLMSLSDAIAQEQTSRGRSGGEGQSQSSQPSAGSSQGSQTPDRAAQPAQPSDRAADRASQAPARTGQAPPRGERLQGDRPDRDGDRPSAADRRPGVDDRDLNLRGDRDRRQGDQRLDRPDQRRGDDRRDRAADRRDARDRAPDAHRTDRRDYDRGHRHAHGHVSVTVIRDTYVTHLVDLDVNRIVVGEVQVVPVLEVLDEDRIILLIRILLENDRAWGQAQHLTRVLHEKNVIAPDMVVIGREQSGRILIIPQEKFDSFKARL